ncbi:MAG TPA: 2-polyprenyl-3-methyl-6-methoxy-1,4-benzoquinone monooxygenase [Gammaproteobacteria bacterium]|nr:2-polyprenyl-3-methyl-6-methoxy-1,4-benzoquinone monooxygenase [Gammaproteobacteria bacterium]
MHGPLAWRDRLIGTIDQGLRTLASHAPPARSSPADALPEPSLTHDERRRSAALLRVNHAGEIAAQALYSGQALVARSEATRAQLQAAASEEHDHLAWCAARLRELGGRASVLDPLWYVGSFCIGVVAGSSSDRSSLGFVAETERQVEAHLQDHLERLPKGDRKSHAILSRMASDEAHHGTMASLAGGTPLPAPIRSCMSLGGGLLRRIALFV